MFITCDNLKTPFDLSEHYTLEEPRPSRLPGANQIDMFMHFLGYGSRWPRLKWKSFLLVTRVLSCLVRRLSNHYRSNSPHLCLLYLSTQFHAFIVRLMHLLYSSNDFFSCVAVFMAYIIQ